ncbi:MAG: hypothetical protein DRO67_00190 [Candidatus Asgardarchaeum californiense]|nr:MAG: hypothetical protein DRO67_00190 [Candidatus Asgardarchaeum californiense]
MDLTEGMWVAVIFNGGQRAVGHVREEYNTLYINCITEDNAVTTIRGEDVENWCEIQVNWEAAE